jgi:hypothetical protein
VGRDGGDMEVIWGNGKQDYFCEAGWTVAK